MNEIILEYYRFLAVLDRIETYTKRTYVKNNELKTIIENYPGDNKELLLYYNSIKESQIQYNAIIITLYGAYENYIDNISKCYLSYIFNHYNISNDLPVRIKDTYRKNIGDVLSNPGRYGYTQTSADIAAKNYSSFLAADFNDIDYDIILTHSGNLRSSQLESFLKSISLLENSNLFDSDFVEKYYIEKDIYDRNEFYAKRARNTEDIFKPLNDLVVSRNIVAHSGEDSSRISSATLIDSTIPFLSVVSRVVLDCIIKRLSDLYFEEKAYSIINVFDDHILCLNNNGNNLRKGGLVIYKHNGLTKNAIINKIELNHKEIDETGNNSINVGLDLDNNININDSVIGII